MKKMKTLIIAGGKIDKQQLKNRFKNILGKIL